MKGRTKKLYDVVCTQSVPVSSAEVLSLAGLDPNVNRVYGAAVLKGLFDAGHLQRSRSGRKFLYSRKTA